jgi:hypothetical protein
MRNQPLAAAALVALLLSACNRTTEPNVVTIDNDAATPVAGAPTAGPNALNAVTAAAEIAATEAGKAPTAAKLPTLIPDRFHGRWGLTKADCTSTRGDAKGLLTIDDARLTFYESKGMLDHVLAATDTSFDANYGFSGEGQNWERVERLKMVNANLNRRTDAQAGQEPPVNLTYMPCST